LLTGAQIAILPCKADYACGIDGAFAFMKFSAFDSIEDIAWETGGEVADAAGCPRAVSNPNATFKAWTAPSD
jgi:hypothetical protein